MIHAVLDWVAGDGFADYFSSLKLDDWNYADVHQWRQRYLIAALRSR